MFQEVVMLQLANVLDASTSRRVLTVRGVNLDTLAMQQNKAACHVCVISWELVEMLAAVIVSPDNASVCHTFSVLSVTNVNVITGNLQVDLDASPVAVIHMDLCLRNVTNLMVNVSVTMIVEEGTAVNVLTIIGVTHEHSVFLVIVILRAQYHHSVTDELGNVSVLQV